MNEILREAQSVKECRLNGMRKVVEGLVTDYQDERGIIGIDEELKEGIAVLLAMDFQTESCCWGHPEKVDIEEISEEDRIYSANKTMPRINFSGYHPSDGYDADDNPIGYTKEQVESASKKAERDAEKIRGLINGFYQKYIFDKHLIKCDYKDRFELPIFSLVARVPEDFFIMTEANRSDYIEKTREQWAKFLEYLREQYLDNVK